MKKEYNELVNDRIQVVKQPSNHLVSQNNFSSLRYYLKNSFMEMKRRYCAYALALLSVAVVVCAACITQTLTDKTQLIFLQTAEIFNGEIDMIIYPSFSALKFPFNEQFERQLINFNKVKELLTKEGLADSISPRNEFTADLISVQNKTTNTKPNCTIPTNISSESINEIPQNCYLIDKQTILFIQSDLESQISLGRTHLLGEIPEGQILLNNKTASKLRVKEGDELILNIDCALHIYFLLDGFCSLHRNQYKTECEIAFLNLRKYTYKNALKVSVFKVIDQSTGKLSSKKFEKTVFMEHKYLMGLIIDSSVNQLSKYFQIFHLKEFSEFLKTIDNNEYSEQIILNFPKRESVYVDNSFSEIETYAQSIGSRVVRALGIYPVSIDQPITKVFHMLQYASMFLSIVTNMVILLFSALSIMMLYNLLLVSVETKTYELGVLRILGLNQKGIVYLVLTQSFSFVFPGLILGVAAGQAILNIGSNIFKSQVGFDLDSTLSFNSISLSLFLGVFIPLAAAAQPIRIALGKSLSFALTKDKAANQAVKVTITGTKSVNFGQVSVGLVCVVFGFSIYYLLPVALFQLNINLMVNVFFFVLLGLLIGMITVAVNFAYIMEKLVLQIVFFWISSATRSIVAKNLVAHRIKNTRTASMYALSIAFVIFVWSALTLQIDSQSYSSLKSRGAEIVVTDPYFTLNVEDYDEFLSSKNQTEVTSYTFASTNSFYPISYREQGSLSRIVNRGGMVSQSVKLFGVQPNYLKVAKSEFVKVDQRSSSALDIVEELYATPSDRIKVILMKSQADNLFFGESELDLEETSETNDLYIEVESRDGTTSQFIKVHVSAIVTSFPGINNNEEQSSPSIIVSMPTFHYFIGEDSQQPLQLIYDRLLIQADMDKAEGLKKELKKIGEKQLRAPSVWTFQEHQKDQVKNEELINLIFSGLCLVVMFLCFFSLVSSMTSNIFSSAREIAILRAVGVSKARVCFVYVIESFVLVFSSCLIGVFVGMAIGYSMSMQRQLFTQMAIKFKFPWFIFLTLAGGSTFCAFASTLGPILSLVRNSVSKIARNAL